MKNTIDFIVAGSEVSRYHTVRTIVTETVGHHSHGVAMICVLLTGGEPSANLLTAALIHDLAEHQTGDIPSPAKREYGIGDQVSELEDRLLSSAGIPMPLLSQKEQRLLKLADIAQGMLYCIRETQMGNANMGVVFHRYRSYAESMVLVGQERELFNVLIDMYNGV